MKSDSDPISLTRGYSGGNTWTSKALSSTNSAYNNYARKGSVKHITVVITDGYCTCSDSDLISTSANLKKDSVYIPFQNQII